MAKDVRQVTLMIPSNLFIRAQILAQRTGRTKDGFKALPSRILRKWLIKGAQDEPVK